MADSLLCTLAIDNSEVTSQTVVNATITLTDASTTPRSWTVQSAKVIVTPNSAADVSPVQLDASGDTEVPAGGVLYLATGIVPFNQSQGSNDTVTQMDVSCVVRTESGVVSADGPIITVVSATDASKPSIVLNGKLDFRSNKRSAQAVVLRLV